MIKVCVISRVYTYVVTIRGNPSKQKLCDDGMSSEWNTQKIPDVSKGAFTLFGLDSNST